MEEVFLGSYDDEEADWHVLAHDAPDFRAPEAFHDPPDFAQTSGYDNQSDTDEDYASEALGNSRPGPKPGGYDSRVEQILYENPNLPILITDAGKGSDGTKYIVYTIRTGVSFLLFLKSLMLNESGFGSSQAILRICFAKRRTGKATSYPYYPSDPREAYYGRLRCKPYESEAGSADDRFKEAHVGRFLEPMSQNGRGSK
jgi:hypothetical protein